jgi:hypothetical protein
MHHAIHSLVMQANTVQEANTMGVMALAFTGILVDN